MNEETKDLLVVITVTLTQSVDPRISPLSQMNTENVLLPISSIATLKLINNAEYEIKVKEGCEPKTFFPVGKITATLPDKAILVLNKR